MKNTVLILAAIMISSSGFLAFKFTEPEQSVFEIKYRVDCKACEVTFRDEQGNSKDIFDIQNSWTYKFIGEKGQFIYVSANSISENPVKVTILKNGETFATDEATLPNLAARAGTIL